MEAHEMKTVRPSNQISLSSAATKGSNSEDESSQDVFSDYFPQVKKRSLFQRLFRNFYARPLFDRNRHLTKSRQKILIKCQQPSIENQDQTNV